MERLLDEGWSMRALVRGASKLGASVRQHVEVVEGDAESNKVALFHTHSMGGGVPTAAIQAAAAIVRRG